LIDVAAPSNKGKTERRRRRLNGPLPPVTQQELLARWLPEWSLNQRTNIFVLVQNQQRRTIMKQTKANYKMDTFVCPQNR
jgi:hypothetical protein